MKRYMKLIKESGKTGAKIGRNPLRTSEVEGWCYGNPEAGSLFYFYGRSLTPGQLYRRVETSVVTEVAVLGTGVVTFETQNSRYRMEPIGKPEWAAAVEAFLDRGDA